MKITEIRTDEKDQSDLKGVSVYTRLGGVQFV